MEISSINIIIDYNSIKLSESGYEGIIYFQADDYVYPYKNCISYPLHIIRWLLKEMRLLLESKADVPERYVYFNTEKHQHIYLRYLGDDLIRLEFSSVKTTIPKINNMMFMTVFSKNLDRDLHLVTCHYSELFKIAYEEGRKLFNMFNVEGVLQDGIMIPLEGELQYAKRVLRKLEKLK
jgi:hypothetical protein